MKYENLIKVELEAKRFLGLVEDAKKAILKDSTVTITGSKETAACRRASMDLTRALAVLRGKTGKK
jgi:hypothetical protein